MADEEAQGADEGGMSELTSESIAEMSPDQQREALAQQLIDGDAQGDPGHVEGPAGDVENQGEDVNLTADQRRIAELEQQLRDQQLKYDRQGTEVGELRNHLKAQKDMLMQSIQEDQDNGFSKLADDPFGAMRQHEQKRAELHRIHQQEQMLNFQERVQMNKNFIGSQVKDSDALVENVRELLKADGVPEQQAGRVDVFGMNQDTAYNLFKRAELARENGELKAEIERLRGNRGNVLDSIDRAARSGGRVAGKAGNSVTEVPELTRERIRSMSLDEKKKMLAKLQHL